MKIELIIDNREKDLCKYYADTVIKQNLDLGDIIIKINDKICVLIERKTISDLDKSIKDGRYKEQKNRIIHSLNLKIRKIYLIEGTNMNNFSLPHSAFNSVIYNTMIRDNLHIIRSNDIYDTIKIINDIYKRCEKFSKNIYNNIYENGNENNNKNICHIKKKNNMTKKICFINQYRQIPGISENIACVLYDIYGSLYQLYKKFYNNDSDNYNIDILKKEISEIRHGASKRRIGMKTANKICEFII